MQNPQEKLEIKNPAFIFLSLKAFTWLSLLISAYAIYGGNNFIYVFKHAFVNWDAIWYLKIAAFGYVEPRQSVFFPLMPLAIKTASFVIRDFAWAGILASNIFSFAGAVFFYNLVKDSRGAGAASAALVFFLAAPTALFYSNLYAESLFFMLSVMVFYFAGKKQWLAAALSAGLASAARNYGVLLAVPLLWEFFADKKFSRASVLKAAWLALVSAFGIAAYSAYMYYARKDPLFYINAQSLWHDRNSLAAPFTALFTGLSWLPGLFKPGVDEMKTGLSTVYFCAAIAMNIYGFRKVKGPEFVYLTMMTIFLSFQPMLMSLSRYISAVFVFWLIAAVFVSNRRRPLPWAVCLTAALLAWQAVINFRWMAGLWVG